MGEVIQHPAAISDNTWRPVYYESRKAWVCERKQAWGKSLQIERFGARMAGREEMFSPAYFFREEDAAAQCEKMNGASEC